MTNSMADRTTVVCDLGSGTTTQESTGVDVHHLGLSHNILQLISGTLKVGYAGNMYPKASVPCVVEKSTTQEPAAASGKVTYKPVIEMEWQNKCVEASGYVNPCVNGVVSNWDAMRVVLSHALSKLQVRTHQPAKTVR